MAEKENEKFGQFVGKEVNEMRLELGSPSEDFVNELGNEMLIYKTKKYGIPCERKFEINATGTIVGNSGNIYEATVGGTTGASSASSAPTHGSGTATDGTVTWTFRGTRPAVTCTVADTEFKRFKYFSSKLVMLSSNTSSVPEAKQLRIIALQA